MAEYPYVSEVLNYYNGTKYIAWMVKGKYKPFYSVIGTLDFIKSCREVLFNSNEEHANKLHEVFDQVWFPAYIQLESGNYISQDLMKRLDEKLYGIIEDPLKKVSLIDMYDAIFKQLFYVPENDSELTVHPAYLLINMQNEDKEKFKKLHQCNMVSAYIKQLREDYPKHRMP